MPDTNVMLAALVVCTTVGVVGFAVGLFRGVQIAERFSEENAECLLGWLRARVEVLERQRSQILAILGQGDTEDENEEDKA